MASEIAAVVVGAARLSGQIHSRGSSTVEAALRAALGAGGGWAVLETALVAGGAKSAVLDVFAADRCILRVGCLCKDSLFLCTGLQTMQERY